MNKVIISVGRPINNTKDIIDFLLDMEKEHNIKKESGIVDFLVNTYKKSPKGKDHIVMFKNDKEEWFSQFLADEDVITKMEL